jgi:flavodoxin I
MANVAVVYWSGTGNTEAMADLVAQGANDAGGKATVIAAEDFDAGRRGDFDAFAFGCPAMGDEDLEETTFEPMYDEVESRLQGQKVALFGSYDWNEGEWMDKWDQRAANAGLNVVGTAIAKDYPDDDASEECGRLGTLLAE